MEPGDQISGWRLGKRLGEGGNAEVWLAAREDGVPVALKILKTKESKSESYQRFRDEIGVLRSGDLPAGVLPLLDANLPEKPSKTNRAWLAMPVATSIRDALASSREMDRVVGAIAMIAETLALLAQRGIYHRDLKPSNLYEYQNGWAIGDFGLVKYPGKDEVTRQSNRQIGPAHFIAPEMVNDPQGADPGPADVFSLAKTLWVLAVGDEYPPQGEFHLDRPELRLSSFTNSDPRAVLLDPLLAQATKHVPNERPTMAKFAADLGTWLSPTRAETRMPHTGIAAERLRIVEAARKAESQRLRARASSAERAFEPMAAEIELLRVQLEQDIPTPGGALSGTAAFEELSLGRERATSRAGWQMCRVAEGSGPMGIALTFLACGGAEICEDGALHVVVAFAIREAPHTFTTIWSQSAVEIPNTAASAEAIVKLGSAMVDAASNATDLFVQWIEAPYGPPQARSHLAGAVGTDDKIYVAGGQVLSGSAGAAVSTAEVFDTASRFWKKLPPMPTPRMSLAVARGGDGRIYCIGGEGEGRRYEAVEVYDPEVGTWTFAARLPTPLSHANASTLSDGRILLAGGDASPSGATSMQVLAYDPARDRWDGLRPMPEARRGAAIATGADGRVYVIGGVIVNRDSEPTSSVVVYDPEFDSWTDGPPMPTARCWLAATTARQHELYAIGGYNQALRGTLSIVEILNITDATWRPGVDLGRGRDNFVAVADRHGTVYAIGGTPQTVPRLYTVEELHS